jgi:hypothetical protein
MHRSQIVRLSAIPGICTIPSALVEPSQQSICIQSRIAARVSSTESFRVLRQSCMKIKGPAIRNVRCARSCLTMIKESSVPCTHLGSISFGSVVHGAVRMQKRAADKFGPRNYPVPEFHAIQTKMGGLISMDIIQRWSSYGPGQTTR